MDDGGRSLLGTLTLPALEKLAEVWAHELDRSWIEAKQNISEKSAKEKSIPDYLGMTAIEAIFYAQASKDRQAARDRLGALYDTCREASEGQSISVLDRVSTVFVGMPEGSKGH